MSSSELMKYWIRHVFRYRSEIICKGLVTLTIIKVMVYNSIQLKLANSIREKWFCRPRARGQFCILLEQLMEILIRHVFPIICEIICRS
jgi:hypothetical protein